MGESSFVINGEKPDAEWNWIVVGDGKWSAETLNTFELFFFASSSGAGVWKLQWAVPTTELPLYGTALVPGQLSHEREYKVLTPATVNDVPTQR